MARNLEKQEQEQREEAAAGAHGHQPHAHHVHQFRHSRGTIIMWTVCVIFTLLGIFAIIGALTTPATPGNSTGDGVGGGAFFLVVGVILGVLAWSRKPLQPGDSARYASQPFTRTSAPAATSSAATASAPATTTSDPDPVTLPTTLVTSADDEFSIASPPRYRGRHHVKDPRKQFAIFGVLFAISILALISGIGLSERSSYTQHHGVSVQAQVVSYDNHQSCDRSSCSETFAAAVTLASPVKGRYSTVLHGRGYFPADDGQTISALVDPHDPGYGELPGNTLDAGAAWVIFLVIAVVCGLLCMSAVYRLFHYHPGILPGRHLPGS